MPFCPHLPCRATAQHHPASGPLRPQPTASLLLSPEMRGPSDSLSQPLRPRGFVSVSLGEIEPQTCSHRFLLPWPRLYKPVSTHSPGRKASWSFVSVARRGLAVREGEETWGVCSVKAVSTHTRVGSGAGLQPGSPTDAAVCPPRTCSQLGDQPLLCLPTPQPHHLAKASTPSTKCRCVCLSHTHAKIYKPT